MIPMQLIVEELSENLIELGAISVFLYGSRARGEELPDSDWELGAIFKDNTYKHRKELAKLAPEGIIIYPFRLSELKSGNPQTPFTKSIWLNEIVKTSHTVTGELIIENLSPPKITERDLETDVVFYKARALDAMLAARAGSIELARDLFVKSCLLGLRDLILLNGGEFPSSFSEIAQKAKRYLPDEFVDLPQLCLSVRTGHEKLTMDLTFRNISLLTDFIERKLTAGNT